MKFSYYKDTDSLYIELAERASADTREVAPNVVLDFDSEGNIVGIDIYQYASKIIDLRKLEFETPFAVTA
ncbi:MAG: DUF2283 domain-containing protein [Candidatus Kapaibacterium sp.]